MRHRLSNLLRKSTLPFTLVVVALLGYYLYRDAARLLPSLEIKPIWLGFLCLGMLVRFYVNSVINQITLAELGAKTGHWETFSLMSVAAALQMFLPFNSGAVFRAMYLKRRYQLAYSHFLSTQFGIQIMAILISCGTAMTALALVADLSQPDILVGMVLCGSCFTAAFILMVLPPLKRSNNRLWDKLALISEGCHALRKKRTLVFKMLLLSIIKTCCDACVFWCGCLSVGLSIQFLGATALTTVASVAAYFRLTPGALGTYEALIGLVSQAASLTSAQAITVSLVVRGASYVLIACLFPICTWWLVTRRGLRWNEQEIPAKTAPTPVETVSQAA